MKIVSKGGTTNGTQVFNDDGSEIKNITRIVIDPLEVKGTVTATLTITAVELDIEAEDDAE